MFKIKINLFLALIGATLMFASCKVPSIVQPVENRAVPAMYSLGKDTVNTATVGWRNFFVDKYLVNLIDTALKNNQELLVTLQEVEIARNEILFRQGKLLPSVGLKTGIGVEKVGRYTSQGAGDASAEIIPGKYVPEALMDYTLAAQANWEIDIWKKLHTAKKASEERYLATLEGRNFLLTNLIAEVASSYYELLALDNQLEIIRQSIALQKNALEIMKVQKEAARTTELAVQKFQAEVLSSQSLEYDVLQKITEAQNRINFLLGRYPQEIPREKSNFLGLIPATVNYGTPAQLLANRPDIKQAELELAAAKLDIKAVRAEFYPSLGIAAGVGLQAFRMSYLTRLPESVLYSLGADLAAPLINRKAIKAEFNNANARQLQALYNYQRTVLNAYMEVSTQLARIDNLQKGYELKFKEVDALTKSIDISNDLFKAARADYFEVLMTQRDALQSKLELIETKKNQMAAETRVYRDLGGGWK